MRPDHLTFLVLAGAVALVAFAVGAIPCVLLPPAFPAGVQGTSRGAQRLNGAQRPPQHAGGYPGGYLDASGALAAQERTGKRQSAGIADG